MIYLFFGSYMYNVIHINIIIPIKTINYLTVVIPFIFKYNLVNKFNINSYIQSEKLKIATNLIFENCNGEMLLIFMRFKNMISKL